MNYIVREMRRFCGFIAGFIFYISGIVKLLDPVGAGLVMDEYYNFLHLGFLDFSAKFMGTAFAFAETLIGAALITGVWRKITAIAAFAIQGFFTFLTLLLVIFNPEMDCGCFGEAIHLTHWQTFLKNIGILLLLAGDFIPMRELGEPKKKKYVSFAIVTLSTLVFTIYSWLYIPLKDFTDYKPTAMIEAADAYGAEEKDRYEAVFIYEKDGVQKTFDIGHLPDSTWTFVDTKTVIKEEFEDPAVSLSFFNADGEYMDNLAAEGKAMVISLYNPEISVKKWTGIARFTTAASAEGFRPLILVSASPQDFGAIVAKLPEDIREEIVKNTYFSDYKTLITLNRSNGGITYFSDGYLIRKWARRTAPSSETLHETASTAETEILIGHSSQGSLTFQGFLLYVFAVMLLM